ncbi:MoaD/ThiS family protein [Longispora albida]|uniref:MoaD/ThiS family protein n=1 Tax=Longispora albida TaxID=203523 RepID=UPI0005906693|nr:MoaD/ThiS family protein [Longispora albida]
MLTVRYFAGARAAAGLPEQRVAAGTLGELVTTLSAEHGEELARVLKAASFLVNEVSCRDHAAALPAGATVDVLPPFAGG